MVGQTLMEGNDNDGGGEKEIAEEAFGGGFGQKNWRTDQILLWYHVKHKNQK